MINLIAISIIAIDLLLRASKGREKQASASTGISKPYISQLCTGARKVQKHHEYVFSHYRTPFAEEVTE